MSSALSPTSEENGGDIHELTPEEEQEVRELKKRDAEVRRHELAHKAAAGRHAVGGAQYQYVIGPDGRRYAVSGEVKIDTSEVPNDPEATIRKARTIRRAALAPMDPSPQDRRLAAEASRMEARARQELLKQQLQTEEGALPYQKQTANEPSSSAAVNLVV